ncbi:protein kinase-like domain, concanavalin A-like lectin/glucanase domain protein [Tanacetum coccineum]
MENANLLSSPGSPISPVSRRVRKLDKLLESLEKNCSTPTNKPFYIEEELEIMSVEENKVSEELEEEFEEEEEDDLEYFNAFPTREELEYHGWLMKNPQPFWVRAKVKRGSLENIKILCMIGYFLKEQTYIDLESPVNIMYRLHYNSIMCKGLKSREKPSNPSKTCNFVGRVRDIKVFVSNFTYECDFMVLEDVSSVIDHYLDGMILGKSFVKQSKLTYDKEEELLCLKRMMRE